MNNKSISQSLREVSDQFEKLFLKIFKGTFLLYEHPDIKWASQLKKCGVPDDDIDQLLRDIHNSGHIAGVKIIDHYVYVVCLVYIKGLLCKDEARQLIGMGVNLIPTLSMICGLDIPVIWDMIENSQLKVSDFRRSIRWYSVLF